MLTDFQPDTTEVSAIATHFATGGQSPLPDETLDWLSTFNIAARLSCPPWEFYDYDSQADLIDAKELWAKRTVTVMAAENAARAAQMQAQQLTQGIVLPGQNGAAH